jgi:hypothetical protein
VQCPKTSSSYSLQWEPEISYYYYYYTLCKWKDAWLRDPLDVQATRACVFQFHSYWRIYIKLETWVLPHCKLNYGAVCVLEPNLTWRQHTNLYWLLFLCTHAYICSVWQFISTLTGYLFYTVHRVDASIECVITIFGRMKRCKHPSFQQQTYCIRLLHTITTDFKYGTSGLLTQYIYPYFHLHKTKMCVKMWVGFNWLE